MCGIFGVSLAPWCALSNGEAQGILLKLALLSQNRGSEASGLALASSSSLKYLRASQPARAMLKSGECRRLLEDAFSSTTRADGMAMIGHSRLVTNGSQGLEENNQPIETGGSLGIHNGIVVNDADLWSQNPQLVRTARVDTEVIYSLIDQYRSEGWSLQDAIAGTYAKLLGEANIAFFRKDEHVLALASNVGSIYTARFERLGLFMFASERYFLERTIGKHAAALSGSEVRIEQLAAGRAMLLDLGSHECSPFALAEKGGMRQPLVKVVTKNTANVSARRPEMQRCTRCILPHTFPFISFDSEGVCNLCREQAAQADELGVTLEEKLARHRRNDGGRDCIVALSGGRDSCYGLHVLKREFGMNPIAYTYDWAMVTDEARRNCSRVCAELGVEHIIRSADILRKRRNIRLNVEAWLRRPKLGMVPLFMAGDKQFFHYASELSKETGIDLVIFCGGNNLEVTGFKTGFCGIRDRSHNTMVSLDSGGKAKLLWYYARNFLLNPAYINRSMFDSLFAYYSTYIGRREFVYLYKYLEWDEQQIAHTLSQHYGWESSADSASTWRIGDGTAAFYNYIYHTVAGFSEHDTFRSNQIRAGLITRDAALKRVEEENRPRYEAMKEYAQLVGFSLDEALVRINRIPKLG